MMRRGLRVTIAAAVVAVSAVLVLAAGPPSGPRDAFACTGTPNQGDIGWPVWCQP